MRKVKVLVLLVALMFCGILTSCTEDNEVFPKDELRTGGNGEGTDATGNEPPGI